MTSEFGKPVVGFGTDSSGIRSAIQVHRKKLTAEGIAARGLSAAGTRRQDRINRIRKLAKRSLDLIGAFILLIFFLPSMLTIAIAIKLTSPGPVIFRQLRGGINNSEFICYKFRTMYAEPCLDKHVRQATSGDLRITRVGRILRRSSLDELPQLISVLRGDMSLVGPRPHPVELDQYYARLISDYQYRIMVCPGITGWAQVHGLRGETPKLNDMRRRIAHDTYYIDNFSLTLDLIILIKTLPAWLTGFKPT